MASRIAAQKIPTPEIIGLGQRILAQREMLQMGRRDLARATGLAESHLLNIEKGLRIPSATTIIHLCKALGMSADYLLGLKEECHA